MSNKKDFSNIGTMATSRFLSVDNETKPKKEIKEPVKETPKEAIKSKRVNLLIYPDLFDQAKKLAFMKQISFNEYLNRLIALDVEKKKNIIKKYNEIFKE